MTVLGQSSNRLDPALLRHDDLRISLEWGMATDVGHTRGHNEDSLVAAGTLFAVADGMGGHAAGDVASHAVVSRLAAVDGEGSVEPERILQALRAATEDISTAIEDRALGAGTTVTGAALSRDGTDPYWIIFNVGDSRLYLFDDGQLTQITIDHSVVQELVAAGLISPADAEHHPDSNVVTRAVGFSAEPEPDFWRFPATPDSRLLLCSDGLTREVGDGELAKQLAADSGPQDTAEALVHAALESGGRDNVTAIVVDVHAWEPIP